MEEVWKELSPSMIAKVVGQQKRKMREQWSSNIFWTPTFVHIVTLPVFHQIRIFCSHWANLHLTGKPVAVLSAHHFLWESENPTFQSLTKCLPKNPRKCLTAHADGRGPVSWLSLIFGCLCMCVAWTRAVGERKIEKLYAWICDLKCEYKKCGECTHVNL